MAIKKYFIDNELYGVDAMNNVVKSLRTTGVDGEIAGSLLVTKNSSLSVSVAPGRGWVDGCCIEVTEAEMRSVPSTGGTYSVVMQLNKTGEQINDIDIAVTSGEETGAHVLAYVTVSSGIITGITAARTFSRAIGNTSIPVSIQSGQTTLSGSITSGATVTLTVPIPQGTIKLNGVISGRYTRGNEDYDGDYNTQLLFSVGQGLNFLMGDARYWTGSYHYGYYSELVLKEDTFLGTTESSVGRRALANANVRIKHIELTNEVLVLQLISTGGTSYGFNLAWEAWCNDTV